MQHGEVEDNGGVVSNDERLQDNMDWMFSQEESPMIPCGDGNPAAAGASAGASATQLPPVHLNPAAAGASVLLPKDAFTKVHVDKHAQFEVGKSILPRNFEKVCKTREKFQKMEAEGTATFALSPPGARPCVYGFNKLDIQNPEKWKTDLKDLSIEYKGKGGRLAINDILGPVYEIGFLAMGLGASTRHTPGRPEIEGEGKKTRALLHDHFTFSEKKYDENNYRLYSDNKAKAGAPPPATDAAGAAPLSLTPPHAHKANTDAHKADADAHKAPPKTKKSPAKKATAVKKTAPATKAPEKRDAPKKAAKKSTPAAAGVPPDEGSAFERVPPPPPTLSAEVLESFLTCPAGYD